MSELVERLRERKISVDDGSDHRGGWYSHDEPDPLCVQAADRIEALEAKEAAGQWQDIATAPRDGTTVILWAESWSHPDSGYFTSTDYSCWYSAWFGLLDEKGYEPTHWKLLDTPPKPI